MLGDTFIRICYFDGYCSIALANIRVYVLAVLVFL